MMAYAVHTLAAVAKHSILRHIAISHKPQLYRFPISKCQTGLIGLRVQVRLSGFYVVGSLL